jgi:hypothetical protein
VFFGALNTFMGVLFGLPTDYRAFWPAATSYIGFFAVGFACGLPVQGIYGVFRVFDVFAKDETCGWRIAVSPIIPWNFAVLLRFCDA